MEGARETSRRRSRRRRRERRLRPVFSLRVYDWRALHERRENLIRPSTLDFEAPIDPCLLVYDWFVTNLTLVVVNRRILQRTGKNFISRAWNRSRATRSLIADWISSGPSSGLNLIWNGLFIARASTSPWSLKFISYGRERYALESKVLPLRRRKKRMSRSVNARIPGGGSGSIALQAKF